MPAADLLIATFSGRSLAASARAAGYVPLVADLFADNDLRDLVADFRTVQGDFVDGFDDGDLLEALHDLSVGRAPVGVVCGPGFEDRPELLDAIAARWPLLGNSGETVRRLKDPLGFAGLCRAAGIRHPETQVERPGDDVSGDWLSKRVGAAGGLHIGRLADRAPAEDRYYQRFVAGDRRSALFVAAGGRAEVLGLSEQWPSPSPTEPFRYGGACGPVRLSDNRETRIRRAVAAVAAAVPALQGICSADFILDGEEAVLLEINPRPGASMDVFERPGRPLLEIHLDACAGRLPGNGGVLPTRPVRAATFAYSETDEITVGAVDWPDFVSDRPMPGTVIRYGEPICTLKADGETPEAAMALLATRLAAMKNAIEGGPR